MSERKKLTLEDLVPNAKDLFDKCLERVHENLADLTYDPKAKREIVLTITVLPESDNTDEFQVFFSSNVKLPKQLARRVAYGTRDNKQMLLDHVRENRNLFDRPDNVTNLHAGGEGQ